jgi:hypothetical protein
MELQRVVTIVESLAAGVDPDTGAHLAHDVFQAPEVVQALGVAANLLKERGSRPAAAGQRWTDDEDSLLCHAFDGGTPVPDIARQHGRSTAAITLRLVKLGRIDADTVKVRDRGSRVA